MNKIVKIEFKVELDGCIYNGEIGLSSKEGQKFAYLSDYRKEQYIKSVVADKLNVKSIRYNEI